MKISKKSSITEAQAGMRFDAAAAQLFPDYSRARLQEWIKSGALVLDGKVIRIRDKVSLGQKLSLEAELEIMHADQPEPIELEFVYQDEFLAIVNKPAGLVVHPAHGNEHGTMMNGLLHVFPDSAQLPRAGIIHRLDKDTSGLLVIAKTVEAHTHLVNLLKDREIKRTYLAICNGAVTGPMMIKAEMGRHPQNRKKMAVVPDGLGKHALTHVRILERFKNHTFLECRLETGRTHQIRVHLAHKRHGLLGDQTYGSRQQTPKGMSEEDLVELRQFKRQALHAWKLAFIHPMTGKELTFEKSPPDDFKKVLSLLGGQLFNA